MIGEDNVATAAMLLAPEERVRLPFPERNTTPVDTPSPNRLWRLVKDEKR